MNPSLLQGNLYGTDNGPNVGFGGRSMSCTMNPNEADGPDPAEVDELNLIKKGGYYGQANRKRGEIDSRQCIWRSVTEPSDDEYTAPIARLPSSSNGIVEFASKHFNSQLRGNLVIGRYKGALYYVGLSGDGESVTKGPNVLLQNGGVGVTQSPDGSLYVARNEIGDVLYHRPEEPPSTELIVNSVFPRRGPRSGGSILTLYGENLDKFGIPTVTVGDKDCPLTGANSGSRISCILPSGSETVDVIVSASDESDTLARGYRYISGVEEP